MPAILQIDFPHDGPFGPDLAEAVKAMAEDIAKEPGLRWKIWTEDPTGKQGGGIYLFEDAAAAKAFREKQVRRLQDSGHGNIRAKIFSVNEALTGITRGPVG